MSLLASWRSLFRRDVLSYRGFTQERYILSVSFARPPEVNMLHSSRPRIVLAFSAGLVAFALFSGSGRPQPNSRLQITAERLQADGEQAGRLQMFRASLKQSLTIV